ncbi:hypothetical protein LDU51_001961 [Salmonella enterica]|nr:helix-turn-helix domain-containing protein [Salmonella enterica]ECP3268746.1 helix-turn-helix domain-containing protein [Salmonella enterica subsp. enterica serovar [1],13,23:g,z51:-]EDQ7101122.1 helix-turn-helix domain-containing protein [Salmonella enterica subsp. houtenae serovar 48:g,z51:-]SUG38126.1 Uncharacterised protein [Salmonella enterica subsp. arizonae]EAW6535085.1 helix-turn-helix domain-containing protein [Salmonella enterica]
MKLTDYIEKHYDGNKTEFARQVGVKPPQVHQWIEMKCIVIDGVMYSPRRELPPIELKK